MANGKKNSVVMYTQEMKEIIKEEARNHPNNLREGFRVAAERIKKEVGEPNVTTDKISTHYYTYFSDRKSGSQSTKKPSSKASNKTSSSSGTKATQKNDAPTAQNDEKVFVDAESNKQYLVVRGLSSKLNDDGKIQLINDLYAELS
jgi:hypothetical protein